MNGNEALVHVIREFKLENLQPKKIPFLINTLIKKRSVFH
jgi:hypothetical protein